MYIPSWVIILSVTILIASAGGVFWAHGRLWTHSTRLDAHETKFNDHEKAILKEANRNDAQDKIQNDISVTVSRIDANVANQKDTLHMILQQLQQNRP